MDKCQLLSFAMRTRIFFLLKKKLTNKQVAVAELPIKVNCTISMRSQNRNEIAYIGEGERENSSTSTATSDWLLPPC